MRAWIVLALVAAAVAPAMACPEPDLDMIASGGRDLADARPELAAAKLWILEVPPRPSLFFHRGSDETRPPPTFTDEDGLPLAYVPVLTGIPEFPLRFDFLIEDGTILDSNYGHTRYEIASLMTPRTRAVHVDPWNGYVRITIESDAALLRFEHAGETWYTPSSSTMTRYFDGPDVRVTAFYADRTHEVIYTHGSPETPPPRPPARHRGAQLVLLGALGLLHRRRRAAHSLFAR